MGYPSDLSDAEWQILEPLLPSSLQRKRGRPRTRDLRAILNAIFYVLRGGCAWRMLPRDFPPFQTAYYYLRKWRQDGTWEKIHEVLRDRLRVREGREVSPSAAILDSQTVKTTEKGALEGTMPARRFKAANATSWLTRWACC
jgi:putative transposase